MEQVKTGKPFAEIMAGLLMAAIAGDVSGMLREGTTGEKKAPAMTAALPAPETPDSVALRESAYSIDEDAKRDVAALLDMAFESKLMAFLTEFPDFGGGNYCEYDRPHRGTPHTYARVHKTFDMEAGKKEAVSVLSGDDVFLSNVGRAIALRRALELPVPKEYYTAGSMLRKAEKALEVAAYEKSMDAIVEVVPAPVKYPGMFKVGDKIRQVLSGKEYTIERLANCPNCGKPGFYAVGETRFAHFHDSGLFEKVEPVKVNAFAPGDFAVVKVDKPNGANVNTGDIIRVARIYSDMKATIETDTDTGIFGGWAIETQYLEPVPASALTPDEVAKHYANPGDTVRIITDMADGAYVKAGDTAKVIRNISLPGGIKTPGKNSHGEDVEWNISPRNYVVTRRAVPAKKAPEPAPALILPEEYKGLASGDIVIDPDGEKYTVTTLEKCPNCGFPGFKLEDGQFLHLFPGLKIEKAATAPVEPRNVQVGDTVRLIGKTKGWSNSTFAEIGKAYTVAQIDSVGDIRLDIPMCGWVDPVDVAIVGDETPDAPEPRKYREGDTVRVIAKTGEETRTSTAKVGRTYTVGHVASDGDLKLVGVGLPWVNPEDVELVTEAAPAPVAEPEPAKEPAFKVGDKVRHVITGNVYTVTGFTKKPSGKPAVTIKEREYDIVADMLELVNPAPVVEAPAPVAPAEPLFPNLKVGDTVREVDNPNGPTYTVEKVTVCEICGQPYIEHSGGQTHARYLVKVTTPATVEAAPEPEINNPDGFKPGDRVHWKYGFGRVLTIKALTICGCGEPAASFEENEPDHHLENLEKVGEAPAPVETITRYVKRTANVGESIKRGGTYIVTRRGPCPSCGGSGVFFTGDNGEEDFSHDDVYEVVETVPLWEKRLAKVDETIRATVDEPDGAIVSKGQELTVKTMLSPEESGSPGAVIAADADGETWFVSLGNYEVKNV